MRSRILRVITIARRLVTGLIGAFATEDDNNLLLEDGSRILLEDE